MDIDEAQIDEGLYSRQLQVLLPFLATLLIESFFYVRYVLGHEGVPIDPSGWALPTRTP
jgi:hypothetical protein